MIIGSKIKILIVAIVATISFGASRIAADSYKRSRVQLIRLYVTASSKEFDSSCRALHVAINKLDTRDSASLAAAKKAFRNCRAAYKKISFFFAYFFPNQIAAINAPAKPEIEEPSMEYEPPRGLQQIEALLFRKGGNIDQNELVAQVTLVEESARDLPALWYRFDCNDLQIMQSVCDELVRIKSLYLAGYDCQLSKNGLAESAAALQSAKEMFLFFADRKNPDDKWFIKALDLCASYLDQNNNPEKFNFSQFFADYFNKFESQVKNFCSRHGLGQTSYYPNRLNSYNKRSLSANEQIFVSFGQKLFFDKSLSGNGEISCASCHRPDYFYAEPAIAHERFDKKGFLSRNTPSLLYSAWQTSEFWDGRAASLSEQIDEVLTNTTEMHTRIDDVVQKVNGQSSYKYLLHKQANEKIQFDEIKKGLIAFLSTLAPFNSRFDLYMNGNKNALTQEEQDGFNLFVGKAQCATCHFVPLFNGQLAPDFKKAEYEVLGITASDNFTLPQLDDDPGRYRKYATPFYRGSFKTPTLRNVARTAPYMHNGKFKTLDKVLEFYNRGGGKGMELDVPNQSLNDQPLSLTEKEMTNIISFLKTLTDDCSKTTIHN